MKSFIYVCQFSIILLSNSFAQIHISGALSGVLEDTTYIVDNNIWVAVGDSLVIEAGVVLLFSYNRDFDIYGYLSAIGEVDDSIYFRPNAGVSQWGSLDFNANCSDSSQISYVYFTGAYGSAINLYDTDISISHCTFRDNQATFGGAIYCSSANPYINICVLDSNSAALTGGGGIYMTQGSQPIISDCIIHNNFGGGIYAADTSCFISQGNTITNNTGGGITCSNSYGTIIGCDILNNFGDTAGGIYLTTQDSLPNPVYITNCNISGNEATNYSPIRSNNINIQMRGCNVSNNICDDGESAIRLISCSAQIDDCVITNNQGNNPFFCAILVENCEITVDSCSINDNAMINIEASGMVIEGNLNIAEITNCDIFNNDRGLTIYAGNTLIGNCNIRDNLYAGIAVMDITDTLRIASCFIHDNGQISGMGLNIFMANPGVVIVDSCLISENSVGGIHINTSYNVKVLNTWIYSNSTGADGGGIWSEYSNFHLDRCLIFNNTASENGGGIYLRSSDFLINNCTIHENSGYSNGDGIYFDTNNSGEVKNTIVMENYGGSAIHFNSGVGIDVDYSLVYSTPNHISGMIPEAMGNLVMVNANGDSCDVFHNIFLNPQFYTTMGDSAFYLTEDSPCIDAGDPASPLDPDSTIADIGAYFFDQRTFVQDLVIAFLGNDITLNWGAIPGAVSYNVYRSTEPYFDIGWMLPIASINENSYIDTGALTGSKYFYRVTWE